MKSAITLSGCRASAAPAYFIIFRFDAGGLRYRPHRSSVRAFSVSGRIYFSINRIIVDARPHDTLVERCIAHVRRLKAGAFGWLRWRAGACV
ncbi:hypothetical protein [Methylobacter marinus]|uniref:hypothetical protein n=1 Tax=Methylobacter marinus TaxID=34058 RepID=UPI0006866109|nr:hypothetical protein [Methylobacter marinus]